LYIVASSLFPRVGEVLVIHDDPSILTSIVEVLRNTGYAVSGATQAGAALEAIAAKPPALVLISLTMPEMSGPEMIMHLRWNGHTCPVVLLASARSLVKPFLKPQEVLFLKLPIRRAALLACIAPYAQPNAAGEAACSDSRSPWRSRLLASGPVRQAGRAPIPTCTLCGGTAFQAQDYNVPGIGAVKLLCCAQCGGVMGVLDSAAGDQLLRIRAAVNTITS
jgi:CheY-like chemotaxis protein